VHEGTILKYILFYILLVKNDVQKANFLPVLSVRGKVETMVLQSYPAHIQVIVMAGNKKQP